MVCTTSLLLKLIHCSKFIYCSNICQWTDGHVLFFVCLFVGPNIWNTCHFNLHLVAQFRTCFYKKRPPATHNTQHVWFTSCTWIDSKLNRFFTAIKLHWRSFGTETTSHKHFWTGCFSQRMTAACSPVKRTTPRGKKHHGLRTMPQFKQTTFCGYASAFMCKTFI